MLIKKQNLYNIIAIIYIFAITFSVSTGVFLVKIARLLILFATLLKIIDEKKVNLKFNLTRNFLIWQFIFVVFNLTSLFWTIDFYNTLDMILSLTYIFISNLCLGYLISDSNDLIFTLMKTIIISSIAHALYIYIPNGFNVYLNSRSISGISNAVVLGYICSLGCIFSFIILELKKTKQRKVFCLFTFLNFIFALLTGTRKVIVYIGLFIFIYYLINSKNPIKLFRNIIIIILIFLISYYIIINNEFLYNLIGIRIEQMILGFLGENTDSSTSFRMNLIEWGIEWFKEKPLIGYGANAYRYLLGTNYDTWTGSSGVYAHNNYIELMVDIGIIGTFLYYFIYLKMLLKSFTNINKNKNFKITFALIITLLVTEYGQVSYSIGFLQTILIIIFALMNIDKENEYDDKCK